MNKKCWFDNLPKQLRILIFLVMLVSCFFIGTKFAKAQTTTTVTVNGNTTTTVTTTTTPITSTTVPNVPNYGDQTINSTNSVNTTTTIVELNKNSGNLLTGNFCTGGWTGTQITNSPSGSTSDLGCNYMTGKGSTYAEKTITLTDKGISKVEQNLGFTQSANAQTGFYWYHPQSLIMSHSVTNLDTGETITQNRYLSKNYGSDSQYMTVKTLDNITIGSNSSNFGYTSKLRFDFADSGSGTWRGADVMNPNLSITYTKYTETTTTAITNTSIVISCESLGTCFTAPTIQEPKITLSSSGSTSSIINEEQINPTPKLTTTSTSTAPAPELSTSITGITSPVSSMAPKESSIKTQEMAMATPTSEPTSTPSTLTMNKTSDDKPTTKESSNVNSSSETTTKTSSTTTEKTETTTAKSTSSENTKTEGSSSKTSSSENVSNEKGSTTASGTVSTSNATSKDEKISVSVKAAVEKVEKELKSIGDKTKAIQEIKIDGIKAGAPNLAAYENRAFYEPKYYNGVPNPDFYLQADIAQKPVYANVTLLAYTNNDPIGKQQAAMQQIQDEMNDIIIQLEELKRK
ncbi:hypothetical protein EBU71_03210 [bacterium]|nr:hypothetical protein [Candidatus Elulimicrobium humile]